jgi:hypothetical protein
MLGSGIPAFNFFVIEEFNKVGLKAVYAFSQREVVETTNPDGSVVKTAVFKHVGFFPAN